MLNLIFILFNLINYAIFFDINLKDDLHVRLRRSNFACGKSFIKCLKNSENSTLNLVTTKNVIFGIKNFNFNNGKNKIFII